MSDKNLKMSINPKILKLSIRKAVFLGKPALTKTDVFAKKKKKFQTTFDKINKTKQCVSVFEI